MSAASSQATANKVVTQGAGINGVVCETGTTAVTGTFIKIKVIEAATFTLLTMTDATGDALTGFAFPANFEIEGRITAFTLTSGKVLAYTGAF